MSEPHRRGDGSPSAARTDGGRDDDATDEQPLDDAPDEKRPDDATVESTDDQFGDDPAADESDATPLGDLARRLEAQDGRTERTGGASGGDVPDEFDEILDEESVAVADADELFEEMDVSDVDSEAVWNSVLNGDDTEPADVTAQQLSESEGVEDEDDDGLNNSIDEPTGADSEATETLVPKRSYCESCHFFADPPEATCTYSGAEIVEIVDSEQFRVRNCPVVAGFVNTDGTAATEDGDGLASGSGSSD